MKMRVERAQRQGVTKAWSRRRPRGKCLWCGQEVLHAVTLAEREDVRAGTVEHLVPLSLNGSRRHPANLAIAHRWCNNKRGSRMDWIPRHLWEKGNKPHESQLSAVARFGVRWPWPD